MKEAPSLKYYNPNKSITISVDAISFTLGAVLFQDGKPIASSATAMNEAQQSYLQVEKETLDMKIGC